MSSIDPLRGARMKREWPVGKPTARSYLDLLSTADIHVDEDLWGPGSEEIILDWLRTEYDPNTMPRLAAADVKGREGTWLLGWEDDGTPYPNLLVYLFGEEYRDQQMARIKLRKTQPLSQESRFAFEGSLSFIWSDKR